MSHGYQLFGKRHIIYIYISKWHQWHYIIKQLTYKNISLGKCGMWWQYLLVLAKQRKTKFPNQEKENNREGKKKEEKTEHKKEDGPMRCKKFWKAIIWRKYLFGIWDDMRLHLNKKSRPTYSRRVHLAQICDINKSKELADSIWL